jgi:Uma2 family endonuclease
MLEQIEQIETPVFPVIAGERMSLSVKTVRLSERQFERLCADNRDLKFELSAEGELIIVPPTLPDTGWRNSNLTADVTVWARKDKTGIVFDSSTIFTFPNGAKRSPDVSWVKREKWDGLSQKERAKISKLVPDFVIELRSSTDSLSELQTKMSEYIENGVRLGWLIDPKQKRVHVYRADGEIEALDNPEILSGEEVLPGFELKVREIF